MAVLILTLNSRTTPTGSLSPLDLEISAALVDIFYLTCLKADRNRFSFNDYDVEIEEIHFSNPLGIVAALKNAPKITAKWVLDRTIFYEQEKTRREHENEISRQRGIEHQITNLDKLRKLRKNLISDGVSPEEATKLVGEVLADERINLRITGPRKE